MEIFRGQQAIKFFPNEKSSLVVQPMQVAAPNIARLAYRLTLSLSAENQNALKQLKKKRVLFLPNHPTYMDPVVIFLLSAKMDEEFYYLADHLQLRSVVGPLLQKLGAYSIRRGLPDRESVKHTLDVLKESQSKLVIFPEGGLSYQNDTIMMLREGALHLAFKALSGQIKKEGSADDLLVVPVSIKYRYKRSQKSSILRMLRRMEVALQLNNVGKPIYDRLREIGLTLLDKVENEYHYKANKASSIDARVFTLKEHVITSLEDFFTISPLNVPHRERIYRLLGAIDEKAGKSLDSVEQFIAKVDLFDLAGLKKTEQWEDKLGQKWTISSMRNSLYRVLNFDAFYDGYVAQNPSEERFINTLTRLEREIFDVDMPTIKGSQVAHVALGEPVKLNEYVKEYQDNKEKLVSELNSDIRKTMQSNLDQLIKMTAKEDEKSRL
jgi:1-acyl-sn-glycerol-3-phosphate acyltransferase